MRKLISGAFTVAALAAFLFLLFVVLTRAQSSEIVAVGGSFVLEKTVVAGGGAEKQVSMMAEHGTAGQAIAGHASSGGSYSIYSGFWTPEAFSPTAANATVSGRILTAAGAGVRNVDVTITSPSGEVQSTRSTGLGYFIFEQVPVGATYLVSVSAKRYTFAETTRAVNVADDVTDVDFIATPVGRNQ